tara:strand:+ start:1001 stop:1387 length:387 start_codon:yes stop_codon:yes gene_type:complete
MAYTSQTLADSDFEVVVKTTITGTNGTALKVIDASTFESAANDGSDRLDIVGCKWSVSSPLDVEFNATTNVVALTLNGQGSYGFGDGAPKIVNNGGSGIDGDIYLENDAACVGFIVLKLRKSAGYTSI